MDDFKENIKKLCEMNIKESQKILDDLFLLKEEKGVRE